MKGKKFYTDVNLRGNALKEAKLEQFANLPTTLNFVGRLIEYTGVAEHGAGVYRCTDATGNGVFEKIVNWSDVETIIQGLDVMIMKGGLKLGGTMSMTLTDTDATVTVSTTKGLSVGQALSGIGIQGGTTIASITNDTEFEMSQVATASGAQTITLGSPDYPAADAGDTYRVMQAGIIGGTGDVCEVGDMLICIKDGSAKGNHATVGMNWIIEQHNLQQATESVVGFTRYTLNNGSEITTGTESQAAITPLALKNAGIQAKYSAPIAASSGATITAVTHKQGVNPDVHIYETDGGTGFDEIECDITVAANGDVTWACSAAITGKIDIG